ncbi:MAG: glycosyltransferase family 4 protein [Candidatus Kryptoniota bacterium]
MRVLFLTNIPAPYRVDFFNELGKLCKLTVLFERRSATDRNKEWISDEAINFKPVFLEGIKVGHDSSFCPSVLQWLQKDRFDIFVIGGYSTPTGMLAIVCLRLRRIPFFLNVDGGFIKDDKPIVHAIKKHFIGSATWWLSTGNETNRYLEHYGAKKDRIFIYPFTLIRSSELCPGIADESEKVSLRQKLGISGDRVVLSVGQFIHRKGFDILIKTWKSIPQNITLLIVGGGPDEKKLFSLISEEGLVNVRLIGFKKKDELRDYYRAADLFVLPTREDIWGLVINEAMACGLPIISTNKCIAALELVKDGENGFIVPVEDENALVDKVSYIFSDEELLYNMANKSLERVKAYTIENMAQVHYNLFVKLENVIY